MYVFIFGTQRTGTTLLHRLLGSHPEIGATPNDFDLMRIVRGRYDVKQMKKLMEWKLDNFWEKIGRRDSSSEITRLAMLSHFEDSECKIKLHKTPKGEHDLKAYKSAFPHGDQELSGGFIYTMRNPFAICASRKYWGEAGNAWVSIDENIKLSQLEKTATYIRQQLHRFFQSLRIIDVESSVTSTICIVPYEELIMNPVVSLQVVLNRLKVDSSKEVISEMLKTVGSPYTSYQELESKVGIYTDSVNLWKKKLSQLEISIIYNELGDFLDVYTFFNPELRILFDVYMTQGKLTKEVG